MFLVFANVCKSMVVYRSETLMKTERKVNCTPIPENVLSDLLGASYNQRYMSISKPVDESASNPYNKRKALPLPSFYVEDTYQQELSNAPVWNVKFIANQTEDVRLKRAVPKYKTRDKREPWQCDKKIVWMDLGLDYFPRYLRTVECTKHTCFYGHYRCKPRSFTLRLMRRKAGLCAQMDQDRKIGVAGLPLQLRELWVWEERAVNFCCECAAG